jgi:hypothetical protein
VPAPRRAQPRAGMNGRRWKALEGAGRRWKALEGAGTFQKTLTAIEKDSAETWWNQSPGMNNASPGRSIASSRAGAARAKRGKRAGHAPSGSGTRDEEPSVYRLWASDGGHSSTRFVPVTCPAAARAVSRPAPPQAPGARRLARSGQGERIAAFRKETVRESPPAVGGNGSRGSRLDQDVVHGVVVGPELRAPR